MNYIEGRGRFNSDYGLLDETHLYEGDASNPGRPLCERGWNRAWGTGYSILRGNVGKLGICPVCEEREKQGLCGVDAYVMSEEMCADLTIPSSPLKPGLPLYPFDTLTIEQMALCIQEGELSESDIPLEKLDEVRVAIAQLIEWAED